MGRKPLSDEDKKRFGTYKPSRSREKKGGHKLIKGFSTIEGTPLPPAGISRTAEELWMSVVENLPEGYLSIENLPLMERWCKSYSLYREAEKKVREEGIVIAHEATNGAIVTKKNPMFECMMNLSMELLAIEKQLGFTPATRAGVRSEIGIKEEENEGPVNPFLALDGKK